MAHNNAFFFSTITDDPKPMAPELQKDLEDSFGSIETLKQEFIVTASSMFGPGFVWLVKSRDRKYSLLCTYLAGSPYPGAHYRRQPVDMNIEDKTVAEAIRRTNSWEPVNTVGSHGAQSQKKMAPGGIDLSPILCINMWEHVYLPDYGVGAGGAGGKRAFAESWWHVIDWEVVRKNAEVKPQEAYLT
jgi:superoxide dismutase, Fe-Mn family